MKLKKLNVILINKYWNIETKIVSIFLGLHFVKKILICIDKYRKKCYNVWEVDVWKKYLLQL